MLTSALCTEQQLDTDDFRKWIRECNHPYRLHRKLWEFAFIAQALEERGFLKPGMRGIGFAVGTEPLAALFAKYGCEIVGSDLGLDTQSGATAADWALTSQHAASLSQLNTHRVCPEKEFTERVSFEFVDMNQIPDHLTGFDFCWSAGSVEHVGSLELSKKALVAMTNCCRPGGLSVHTTELNLLSNDKTETEGNTVLYRVKDIEDCHQRLHQVGHRVLSVNGEVGNTAADLFVDEAPYMEDPHLRMKLSHAEYTITSIGFIIEVGAVSDAEREAPPGPTWFNDDFFQPAGLERRHKFGRDGDARLLKLRLVRLTQLVAELRQIVEGQRLLSPAYHQSDVAGFRRHARCGANAVSLGDGLVLAQVLGDTHLFVRGNDPDAPALLRDGATDLPACVNMVRRIHKNETILDVGAGSGYFAFTAARIVGSGGQVIATEPDSALFGLLKRGVAANQFKHVETHGVRISLGMNSNDCSVEEVILGRKIDYVRVGDPSQLEATWAGLATARTLNPDLVMLMRFHPALMADGSGFLQQMNAEGYNVSLVANTGDVLPVPMVEDSFGPDSEAWLLFAARA